MRNVMFITFSQQVLNIRLLLAIIDRQKHKFISEFKLEITT